MISKKNAKNGCGSLEKAMMKALQNKNRQDEQLSNNASPNEGGGGSGVINNQK